MIAKLFKITRSAWIAFFIAFLAAFIMAGAAGAQGKPFQDDNNDGINDLDQNIEDAGDPEVRAKIYGVTFPITELGGCQNYYDCRNFCEDPVNSAACLDFGKKKGFYKDEEGMPNQKEKILEKAKTELGCDSYETCQSFCQIPTNYEKCDSFAKNQGLSGGHVDDPKNKVIMEKAKTILGCDSYATCASYCSDDSNREKCTQFAKETGIRGGEQRVGPGGCTSEATCRSFCSSPDNFQVCRGFASSVKQEFTGPGGCNSEDSCRSYCERNPGECGPPPGGGGGPVNVPLRYDPQEMCNRTPACSWKDNTCQCGSYDGGRRNEEERKRAEEYSKICRENPQRCTPGGIGGSESREDKAAFEKFCRENPERCRPAYYDTMGGRNYDPAIECTKYGGCAWTGNGCQCGTRYEGAIRAGEANPEASCRSGGCSWTGSSCDCSKATQESPALACGRQPGCSWINSACQCGSYSGSGGGGQSGGGYSGAMDPAEGCRRAGGNWQGTWCQMPSGSSGGSSGGSRGGSENYSSGGRPGGPGAPFPGKSSAGSGAYGGGYDASGKYVGGSYGGYDSAGNYVGTGGGSSSGGSYSGSSGSNMSRDSQESACRAGGGSCDWSSGTCNCRGYRSSGTSTGTTSSGSSSGGGYSGGSMDPAEGCSRAGGNWNGSYCQMPNTSSGGTSGSSGGSAPAPAAPAPAAPAPAPAQESQPAPAPAQQSQPAPAPAQESQSAPAPPAPAPVSEPAPAPAVQGITIVRNFVDRILDLFR